MVRWNVVDMLETRLSQMVDELIPEGVSPFLLSTAPPPDWKFKNDHELADPEGRKGEVRDADPPKPLGNSGDAVSAGMAPRECLWQGRGHDIDASRPASACGRVCDDRVGALARRPPLVRPLGCWRGGGRRPPGPDRGHGSRAHNNGLGHRLVAQWRPTGLRRGSGPHASGRFDRAVQRSGR